MKCIVQLSLVTCLLVASCSASEHERLLVFAFSNGKASTSLTKLNLGKAVAEIIDPKALTAFDECVKVSTPTKETKQPVPMANANWIAICRWNREGKGVALRIFADGEVCWRYENALVINGVLHINGGATNEVRCAPLAKVVADRLRQTVPDVVKSYDMLNSGDPFEKR